MKNKIIGLLILVLAVNCDQNKNMENIAWNITEKEYEGFPLFLRYPKHKNVWSYQGEYQKLACLTHDLESVKDNGLPTSDYNMSLIDFDEEVTSLVDSKKNGIVILIETFGGSRNYWFYISDSDLLNKKVEKLKSKYPKMDLQLDSKFDRDWEWLRDYPFELYTVTAE